MWGGGRLKGRSWLGRGDLWIAAAVLALALILLAVQHLWPRGGAAVTVVTPTEQRVLPLSEDATLTFEGRGGLTVTVEVAGGAVRFAAADCPDHLCVQSGWLSRSGACAACVPAGVTLTVGGEAEVDAVAQ